MSYIFLEGKCWNIVLYLVLTFSTVLMLQKTFTSEERERNYNRYNVFTLHRKRNRDAIGLAVKALSNGKIIAVPTDTVYGVSVDATNPEALEMLYTALEKPYYEPVVMCVAYVANVSYWGLTKRVNKGLLGQLFNLPVTVMLVRLSNVYEHINPGEKYLGFRVAKKRTFLHQVINRLQKPLILVSARLQNRSNSIDIEEFKELWPKIELIFDGGKLNKNNRAGSTVVDLSIMLRYILVRRAVACSAVMSICEQYQLTEMEANLTSLHQGYARDI